MMMNAIYLLIDRLYIVSFFFIVFNFSFIFFYIRFIDFIHIADRLMNFVYLCNFSKARGRL